MSVLARLPFAVFLSAARRALHPHARVPSVAILLGIGLLASSSARAQAPATPTPGVGHDYIGAINDVVNPADGSVSLRISVPIPKGRG
jgi:hypothetical protein